MTLNIKPKTERGFTIVELLVVIVVIGILAAITMVSYTGVTAKANGARSQANAQSVQTVAETMNADNGYYPDTIAHFSAGQSSTGVAGTTKVPAGVTIITDNAGGTIITATTGTTGTTVAYSCLTSCTSSTGGRIAYWDYGTSTLKFVYVGAATAAGAFVVIPS